jgi:hypothetical protein
MQPNTVCITRFKNIIMDVYKTQTTITCAAIIIDIMDADERRIRALYFSGMYT